MRRTRVLVALTLVALLAGSLPAIGAPSPIQIAKRALKATKKSDKRSKRALKLARKPGPRGERGPSGATGPLGIGGSLGAQGSGGQAGTAGTDGAEGATGASGASGPTGTTGPQGTARAYASVNDGTDDYVTLRTRGFVSTVVKPGATVGIYCLTIDPSLGIDPTTVAAVASVEFGNSGDHGGSAEVRGAGGGSCAADQFAVHTFNVAGVASDEVSFHLIVP